MWPFKKNVKEQTEEERCEMVEATIGDLVYDIIRLDLELKKIN